MCNPGHRALNYCQPLLPFITCRPVARGGSGGVVRPPPVAHPKDFVPPFSNFVPPFSNFVPPFSNFVPPFSNFVPPFSNFVPPFSNFVPPFSNFVPPLEYVDDVNLHGQCPRGGGCLWMSKSGGVFQIDDVTRGMSKGGGGEVLVNVQEWGRFPNWWLVFHPFKFRPPPPGWLATGLTCITYSAGIIKSVFCTHPLIEIMCTVYMCCYTYVCIGLYRFV